MQNPKTARPTKICFVASTYPRYHEDAAVPWLREQLRRLKDRGYDVTVLAPAFKGSKDHEIDGIPVIRYRYFFAGKEDLTHDAGAPTKIRRPDYLLLTVLYIFFGTFALRGLHRRRRFDILHIHWPFPHGLFGVAAKNSPKAPMVLSFHGAELLLARKFPFVNPVLKNFTRSAAAVTCNSSYTAKEIVKLGTCEPVILPYGSPIPEREVGPVNNDVPKILYVGRLIERKGVEYLLRAMPLILKQKRATLTIVGNGTLLEPLKELAADLALGDVVTFRVDISEDELAGEYGSSDVFVLPAIVDSRGDTEGLGVVLIEALSFHLPVVASGVGGIVDVIIDEKTGLLTAEKSPEALAEALLRVLDDPKLAAELAANGYQHVKTVFDWDKILDRTEQLYNDVLGK